LGKTENCQVAVSLSLASDKGVCRFNGGCISPKTGRRIARCTAAGVPDGIPFATKIEIALAQIKQAQDDGVPAGIVLADPAMGTVPAFATH
jgi:SRSO17 transposase